MKKVRDLRFEFTRMDVEMQYMGMNVVQAFMKSLGMGPDTALMKLREFNKYIIDNMPAISDKIVKLFGPVWKDLKDVFGATTAAAKAAAVAFTNLVGIFDPSVQSTTFNLEKFAAALVDIVHTFATWAENIAKVEEGLAHLTSATALAARGKFGEAGKELGAAGNDVTPGSVGAGVVPGIIGSYGGWKLFKFVAKKFGFGVAKKVVAASGWESVAAGAGMTVGADVTAGSVLAAAGEGAAEGSVAGPWGAIGMGLLSVGAALGGSYVLSNLMDKVFGTKGSGNLTQSSATPDLIAAMMKQESGGNQQAISSKGAIGVMQLMPGTAAALGVDPYNREQNIAGGTELMNRLLKQYHGNLPEALGAYNWNPQGMDRFLAGKATMPSETQNYISSVLRNKGATGSVAVGPITINIAHPDAETAANTAINRLQDMQGKAVQRNLAYQADLAYDY
jgi:hypothetical protein